jgi:hypothetical protein
MAPRVPRRIVAEIDREFDELASDLSKNPRDQLASGMGLFYTFRPLNISKDPSN